MADSRINLLTSAPSTANDDFFVVDGGTNGTRKLNAFSPTLGGNLAVTGTLTANGVATASAGISIGSGTFAAGKIYTSAVGGMSIGAQTGSSYDFLLASPSANTIAYVPTGTDRLVLASTSASTTTTSGALVVGNGTNGGLGVGGSINTGGTLRFHTNTNLPGVGSIGISSTFGLNMYASTGSSYDFSVFNAAGNSLILNPTGTPNILLPGQLSVNGATSTFGTSGSSGTSLRVISGVGTLAAPKYSTLDFRNYNDLKTGAYIRTGNRESDTNEWLLEIAARSNADVLTSVATFGAAGTTFASKVRWGNTGYPGYNAYLSEASTDSQLYPAIARNLVGSTGTGYTIANGELGAYCGFEFRVGDIRWFGATGTFTTGQTVTPVESMRLVSAGNLLIGTTTDNGQKLQVNGTAKVFSSSASTDTSSGALVVSGGVGVGGAINAGDQIKSERTSGTDTASAVLGVLTTTGAGVTNSFGIDARVIVNNSSGTTTSATGLRALSRVSNVSTVTQAVAMLAQVDNPGGGTITTAYGLYVNPITAGGTNYAIYTGGGRINFQSLPTSSAGLAAGTLWNDGGTLKVA